MPRVKKMTARKGTMTITLSLPGEWQKFFDELGESGYNRSLLMRKMAEILKTMYGQQETYPGGLPEMIERLSEYVAQGKHLQPIEPQAPVT